MPMDRTKYPDDWKEIRTRINERSGGKCEWCKAPNGQLVARSACGNFYMLKDGHTFDAKLGDDMGYFRGSEYPFGHMVKIVLTVAHIDHDTTNNADGNLAHLCQKCHLGHDRWQHAETRRRKKAVGDLFEV